MSDNRSSKNYMLLKNEKGWNFAFVEETIYEYKDKKSGVHVLEPRNFKIDRILTNEQKISRNKSLDILISFYQNKSSCLVYINEDCSDYIRFVRGKNSNVRIQYILNQGIMDDYLDHKKLTTLVTQKLEKAL